MFSFENAKRRETKKKLEKREKTAAAARGLPTLSPRARWLSRLPRTVHPHPHPQPPLSPFFSEPVVRPASVHPLDIHIIRRDITISSSLVLRIIRVLRVR